MIHDLGLATTSYRTGLMATHGFAKDRRQYRTVYRANGRGETITPTYI
jgi:hypothetical protein